MKVYKIQHKKTKLFSTGGIEPKWQKTGKNWKTIGQVKSSITLAVRTYASNAVRSNSKINSGNWLNLLDDVSNWEIIEYEVSPTRVHQVLPSDLLTKEMKSNLKDKGFEMD